MSYLALYRKYRPKTFDEVIDQTHITRTLINQIKNDKIGHAYLFCGSRGTGKTSTAKIFARSINCLNPIDGSACGKCEVCKALSNSLDIIEIDAASNNGVDEIRDLREKIKYPPVNGKYKVYIVDEVHMLSSAAFNALLKTLEEPPAHAVFILATTEVHKLPATILSRCMRFDFKLVSTDAISNLIQKIFDDSNIKYDKRAVNIIARAGEGSVRDALSIADMVASYSDSNVTYESVMEVVGSIEKEKLFSLTQHFLNLEVGNLLLELDSILGEGKSPLVLSKEIISYLRDLLVMITIGDNARDMILVPDDIYEKMKLQAVQENYTKIISGIDKLSEVEQDLRYSVHPKIVLETSLVRAVSTSSIEKRIKAIEDSLKSEDFIQKKTLIEKPVEDTQKKTEITSKDPFKDKENTKIDTKDALFGELLKYLRKNGKMILYSVCAEFDKVDYKDGILAFDIEDESTMEIISNRDNIKVFDDFFNMHNAKYKFNFVSREQIESDLIEKFGDKLNIIK